LDFRYSDSDGGNEWPFAQIAVRKQVDGFVRSAARLWLHQEPLRELHRDPRLEQVQRLVSIRVKSRLAVIPCLRLPRPPAWE
jgi:hypothetical protein